MKIEKIHIFVQVAKYGSFTKAAEHLNLPKSTVSKAITELEKGMGTQLLARTTRQQHLTSEGRFLYESCLGPLETIENVSKALTGNTGIIRGHIKLTAPEDLGVNIIGPTIAKISQQYPELTFELLFTDKLVDLIKNGFDLAIRIGKIKESSLKIKPLGYIEPVLVAAPAYLQDKPKITSVAQLSYLESLGLNTFNSTSIWSFKNKNGISKSVKVQPRIGCNQMSGLLSATLAGGGIALIPRFLCQPHIDQQRLVAILPQWSVTKRPVSLLSPLPFSSSKRLRLVTDELTLALQFILR